MSVLERLLKEASSFGDEARLRDLTRELLKRGYGESWSLSFSEVYAGKHHVGTFYRMDNSNPHVRYSLRALLNADSHSCLFKKKTVCSHSHPEGFVSNKWLTHVFVMSHRYLLQNVAASDMAVLPEESELFLRTHGAQMLQDMEDTVAVVRRDFVSGYEGRFLLDKGHGVQFVRHVGYRDTEEEAQELGEKTLQMYRDIFRRALETVL